MHYATSNRPFCVHILIKKLVCNVVPCIMLYAVFMHSVKNSDVLKM